MNIEDIRSELAFRQKTEKDIKWVGTYSGSETCTWEQFIEQIGSDTFQMAGIVIVGKNWWLSLRVDYFYRLRWNFDELPTKQKNSTKLKLKYHNELIFTSLRFTKT